MHAEDWLIFLGRPFGRFHVYLGVVCLAAAVRTVSRHSNCIPGWFLNRHHLLIIWGSFEIARGVAVVAPAVLLLLDRSGVALLLLVAIVVIGVPLVLIDD